MENTILVCEGTPEGIFSAVYYAYEKKLNPNTTYVQPEEVVNYELFTEYIQIVLKKISGPDGLYR